MTEAPESNPTPESTPDPQPNPAQEKGTGELLGRALLASFAKTYLTSAAPDVERPGELTKKAREILKTLPPGNTIEFNKYNAVIPAIISLRYTAEAHEAKLTLAAERLNRELNTAITAEKFYAYLSRLPKYLTGKEVVEAQEAGREQFFTLDGKDIMQSTYDLIIETTAYYLDLLEKEPGKANPLAAVKELYKQEPVASRLILNTWHSVHGYGFYTRKDGAKSEVMTKAEFDKLVAEEAEADLTEIIKNYIGRGDYVTFEKELKEDAETIQGSTWQDVTGQPKELTKWQAVKDLALIYKDQDSVKDLQREFSALVEALNAQLRADYGIEILRIPVEDWRKPYISRRQLYRLGFCNYRKRADNHYRRTYKNGVAIAQDNWDTKTDLYKELDLETYKEQTLEAYIRGYPFYGTKIRRIETNKTELVGYYFYLTGYNYIIDKVAELHRVPEFRRLKIDIQPALSRARAICYLVELLLDAVRALPKDDLRSAKLNVLKSHFLIPEVERLETSQVNKRKADRLIKNLTGFKEPGRLLSLVSLPPAEDYTEDGAAGQPE